MTNNYWDIVLKEEYEKNYFKNIAMFINKEYKEKIVYPPKRDILRALKLTDYNDVKVVILGQDPYHGPNQAHGLSFSVSDKVERPPSLNNIIKELYNDLGIIKANNDLTSWAKEGVLLLNAILTVEMSKPLSHKDYGWTIFTDEIIKKLSLKI